MSAANRESNEKADQPVYPVYYGYGHQLADDGSDFSIKDAIEIARRRWELIVGCVVLGTLGAGIWGYFQPITYSATAKLLIEPENKVVDIDSVVDGVGSDSAAIETQLSLLKSNTLLESFVTSQDENRSADANALRELERMKTFVGDSPTRNKAIYAERISAPGEFGAMHTAVSMEAALIAQNLSVSQEGRSFIINLSYTSESAEEAARTANDLANYYIADQAQRRRAITSDASQFLEERLKELEAELLAAEEAIHQYRSEHPMATGSRAKIEDARLSDIGALLVETRAARAEKETRLSYIRKLIHDGGNLGSLSEVRSSPYMQSLWESESGLRNRETELRLEFGANHPQIVALNEEQLQLENRITAEIRKIVDNVENELQVLIDRERSLEEDMEELSDRTTASASSSDYAAIRLRLLEGKAETSRRIYQEFLIRLKETREQEAIVEANTRLVASATIPTFPSSTSPSRFAILGLLGSSALGFSLAYLFDRTDRRIRNGKDISQILGLECLGLVPFVSKKERGRRRFQDYLEAKPISRLSESLRSVYTRLIVGNEADDLPKVIQITSTVADEGKTTFAVNLATMLALDGKSTLLIDLDLRNPSVHREVDLSDGHSFSSVLRGKRKFDDSMSIDSDTGCHVIAVTSPARDPGKVLRSESLANLIKSMRERYEFIIIDGPPSFGLSDSKTLIPLTDALIFIIRWNATPSDQISAAIDELKQCNANIAGAVLTQIDIKKQWRYGYDTAYYNTNKGYYDDDD